MSNQKPGFKEALDDISQKVLEEAKKNLAAAEAGTIPDADDLPPLKISGSIKFYEHLDENGNLHKEESRYAFGRTINLTAVIEHPDDTFSATLWSSAGGGGYWSSIRTGQPIQTTVDTSGFKKTQVKLDLDASSAKNVEISGIIHYSF